MPIKYYITIKIKKMAQLVSLGVLGTPKVQYSTAVATAFPVGSFTAEPYTGDIEGANATVVLFPTGLNQPAKLFFVTDTVAEIVTAANL